MTPDFIRLIFEVGSCIHHPMQDTDDSDDIFINSEVDYISSISSATNTCSDIGSQGVGQRGLLNQVAMTTQLPNEGNGTDWIIIGDIVTDSFKITHSLRLKL